METQTTAIICPPDLTERPLHLTVEKKLALSPEKVFEGWTTKLDLWFASPGSWLSRIEVNAPFYFETFHNGTRHPHYGRFLAIQRPQLVQFTWVTGKAGTLGSETVVKVELSEDSEGTNLRLTHAGFADEDSRARHEEAWPAVLDLLEERLSRPAD